MNHYFDKAFSTKLKNKYICIILAVIIAVTLGRLIFLFINNKEGHHSDESWSYGYANSYYDPYDFMDINDDVFLENTTEKNINEWVSGSYYNDYITVNEDERFTYGSVIYNKLGDNSPSLYELLLHTVCSFFPGTFSWWFGFSINIVCYIFIEILLYIISKNISGNKLFALSMTLFYGLSRAALNTVLYVRMYALLTLITMLLIYMVQRMIQKEYKKCTFEQLMIILLLFLGGFTHFYYMVFAFFFAAVFSIFLIIKKKWRNLLTFAGTFLLGAVTYVGIYPYGIRRMFAGTDMYEYSLRWPYYIELMREMNYIFKDLFGIPYFYDRYWLLDTITILILLCVVWGACNFLFRKDAWMKKIFGKEKSFFTDVKNMKHIKKFYTRFKEHNELPAVIIMASVFTVLIVTKFSDITNMGPYADRYVMFLFPIAELSVIYFLYCIVRGIINRIDKNCERINTENNSTASSPKRLNSSAYIVKYIPGLIYFALLIFFTCMSMTGKQYYFFERNAGDFVLADYLEDKNVIIVDNNHWTQEWYCAEIYKASEVFFTDMDYDEEIISKIASLQSDKDYVIIVPVPRDDDDENADENEDADKNADADNSAVSTYDESEIIGYSNEEFLDEVCSSLNKSYEYLLTMDSFCGKLEIYSLTCN